MPDNRNKIEIDVSFNGERLFTAVPATAGLTAAQTLFGSFVAGKFTEADGYKVEVFEVTEQRLPVKSVHPTYDRVFYVKLADQIVYGSPDMPNHDIERPMLVEELIREMKNVFGTKERNAAAYAERVAKYLLEHDIELTILFFRSAVDTSKHGHEPMAACFTRIATGRLGPMLLDR